MNQAEDIRIGDFKHYLFQTERTHNFGRQYPHSRSSIKYEPDGPFRVASSRGFQIFGASDQCASEGRGSLRHRRIGQPGFYISNRRERKRLTLDS
jgi:hypothetical protein